MRGHFAKWLGGRAVGIILLATNFPAIPVAHGRLDGEDRDIRSPAQVFSRTNATSEESPVKCDVQDGDGVHAQTCKKKQATPPTGSEMDSRLVDWIVHRVAQREGQRFPSSISL